MYNEKRTVDHILATYTNNVREAATRALLNYGFVGLDPRDDNSGPKTFEDLVKFWVGNEPGLNYFPVNTEGNERTVFTDPTVNLLFRAWHDLGHILLGAPFTRGGEEAVARWQMESLKGIDKQILYADIVDQYDYFARTGKYVEDQRAFVIAKVFGKALPPHSPRYAVVKRHDAVAA